MNQLADECKTGTDGNSSVSAPSAACRPRGRQKVHDSEALRAEIIEHAFRTFQKRSFQRTTMSHIAAECRISKRTLYEMFPGKHELFAEMAIRHREKILNLASLDRDLPLEQALIEIFRADRSEEEHLRQAAEIRLFYVEAVANPDLGDILRQHCGLSLHGLLTGWVSRQADLGRLVTPNATDTAKFMMNVLVAAQIFRPENEEDLPGISDPRTFMRHSIRMLVQGMAPRR
ncbi:TetR/AcrR family transcriptional regulator [Roseibium aestuarii]|uniref:TetR/AcrR family transcriptional regulator n=1 Tax=Roseibium aestuarii TaxID=2600299 RepID=A0ABW4JUJ6_9HYPH|nr:TetR/AcrR family transcriptional regulator [Roseibium aestuarii]